MRICPDCQGQLPDPTDCVRTREMCDCASQSAATMPEPVAAPLVGTGEMVLLRRTEAKDFLAELYARIERKEIFAREHEKRGMTAESYRCRNVIAELEWAALRFRDLTGLPNLRQPQENTKMSRARPSEDAAPSVPHTTENP